MSKDILGSLVRVLATIPEDRLGLMKDFANKLAGSDGETWVQQGKLFLRKEISWAKGNFVTRENFTIDISRSAKVKISYLGDNFSIWFLGTVEEGNPHELKSFTLDSWTYDRDIIVKLGGVKASIMSLADFYAKMKKQPLGPKSSAGDLLADGCANIGYVPQPVNKLEGSRFSYVGLDGKIIEEEVTDPQYLFEVNSQWFVLRAVRVRWSDDGWDVDASSVGSPFRWHDGSRVFSRNSSVLKSSEPSAPAQA